MLLRECYVFFAKTLFFLSKRVNFTNNKSRKTGALEITVIETKKQKNEYYLSFTNVRLTFLVVVIF